MEGNRGLGEPTDPHADEAWSRHRPSSVVRAQGFVDIETLALRVSR